MSLLSLPALLALFVAAVLLSLPLVHAEVQVLTKEDFDTSVKSENWLVSFYAPWCHHCKQLEPTLEKVSTEVAQYADVHIAKIDATKHQAIADRETVQGYPTLRYYKHGASGKYDGPRSLEGIKAFLQRMRAPAWRVVHNPAELRHGLQTLHNVTFVLAAPAACLSLSFSAEGKGEGAVDGLAECFVARAFTQVAEKLQFHAAFALLDAAASPSPLSSLCKYESTPLQEELLYCLEEDALRVGESESESERERDTARLSLAIETFATKNNYPVLSELENHNFKVFAHLNKTMVIAVLDYAQQSVAQEVISLLESVSRRVPAQLKSRFIFGHLDGKRWKTFVRHHEASVPSLLVVDHDDARHANIALSAQDTASFAEIIEKDLFAMLLEDSLPFRDTVAPSLWQKMKHRFETYYPWSVVLVALPVLLFGASFLYPYPKAKKTKLQ